MTHPLYIAFIWHHHQPYYRQPDRDMYILPWVRVHAVKDYLHMVDILRKHPSVHVTFNLVPALIEQLIAYAEGRAEDPMTVLGKKEQWTDEEKRLILNLGFSINWQHIAFRYPRYRELIQRRDTALRDPDTFSRQDYLDLIAWFNLAWTHRSYIEADERLRKLVEKGRDFTPEDIDTVITVHRELCARVIPAYREGVERGQIEITFSPYHHPILSLLIDTDHARRATPNIETPQPPFRAPEDALAQIVDGKRLAESIFGRPLHGIWPSEQAVSPEAVDLFAQTGVRWFVSDEAILGKSLGIYFHRDDQEQVLEAERLYRPYRVSTPHGDVIGVFRDHTLSDKIGFVYMHYPPYQAAEDLIVRLQTVYYRVHAADTPHLVVIALDGENAWEHYEDNGEPFLNDLYRRLEEHPYLQTVTVSEYLDRFPVHDRLDTLATGSWINGDLTTWIGDPAHTTAWSLLRDARQVLEDQGEAWQHNHNRQETLARAHHHIYVAEASDWFWWYSNRNVSDQDALFDTLFRENLANVYRLLGRPVPRAVETPIVGRPLPLPEALPAPFFTPPLDVNPDPSLAWSRAHVLRPHLSLGTMQMAQPPIRAVRVGYDDTYLYIRLELGSPTVEDIVVSLTGPVGAAGDIIVPRCGVGLPMMWRYGHPVKVDMRFQCRDDIIELAVPLRALDIYPGDTVGVRVGLFRDGRLEYAIPADTPYPLPVLPPQSGEV